MLHKFLTDKSKVALVEAIRSVEQQSGAELVIAVRARSGRYPAAGWILGTLSAVITLGFLLFSSFTFSLFWILIDPIMVGIIVGFLGFQLPTLERALAGRKNLHHHVMVAAKATFYDKGIQLTRERIGILIYISLLEGHAEIIADVGIKKKIPKRAWTTLVTKIKKAVEHGADGMEVATLIASLGDILATYIPRSEADVNELADEVCGS